MRLKVIQDIDSNKLWISPKQNNGEFDYWYIMRLMYTDYWNSEWAKEEGKYHVELHVVSPGQAGEENIQGAMQSLCIKDRPKEDEVLCEMLLEYGVSATIWQKTGNNVNSLLRECREVLKLQSVCFGFSMDRPLNRLGATGWDALAGNFFGSWV